jgi:hypothetical protein
MVLFFFYNHFLNDELIKNINNNFESNAGYILIQSYNSKDNILQISDKTPNNKELLHGKLINFNMSLEEALQKINAITIKDKVSIKTIWATKFIGGVYQAYIIY